MPDTQVDFDQNPSIQDWMLSYTARNVSDLDLYANTTNDTVQVFNGDVDNVQMLQEEATPMPPDDLPPGSVYGSFIDIRSDLADGTYQAYVMLDEANDGPTRRLVFTVEGGSITAQQVD